MRNQSMKEATGRKIEMYKENLHNFFYLHVVQGKIKSECYNPLLNQALKIIQNNNNIFPDFTKIRLPNLK